jgi:hypothetical protein
MLKQHITLSAWSILSTKWKFLTKVQSKTKQMKTSQYHYMFWNLIMTISMHIKVL